MPTENKPAETFRREDRYLVIKISKLHPHPHFRTKQISAITDSAYGDALVDCVVVEKDWPEYEPVWQMIERRVIGATGEQLEVVAVINEEGEHFKETVVEHLPAIDRLPVGTELVDRAHVTRLQAERDALQQRLNAADQRIDELTAKPSNLERQRLTEIVERYPNGDPLEYDAAVRKLQQ